MGEILSRWCPGSPFVSHAVSVHGRGRRRSCSATNAMAGLLVTVFAAEFVAELAALRIQAFLPGLCLFATFSLF